MENGVAKGLERYISISPAHKTSSYLFFFFLSGSFVVHPDVSVSSDLSAFCLSKDHTIIRSAVEVIISIFKYYSSYLSHFPP